MHRKLSVLLAGMALCAAESIPRPEYPQPQFQRELWMNLNGVWGFEFDDRNIGIDEEWASTGRRFTGKITVPFSFESKLSGIGDTSFHPWVWYRRSFSLSENWKSKRVLLHFGAVDYRAMVWVNGRLAGAHEGGHTPFHFDITGLLKSGENTVTVRAEDPPTDRSIPRGKQRTTLKGGRGIFYTRTTGIWQPVWLEAVGSSYLQHVRTTATPDGAVRFEAEIGRPQDGLEFHAEVRFGGEKLASGAGRITGELAAAAATVITPRRWSPPQPNLYDVVFELRRGATVLDKVNSYFGFRSVALENGRVTINGHQTFLRMVMDQGYWPDSVLTPPTDEAIQFDIKVAKEMGFNGVRKHQKVEDPRYLYWADKLGFLVSGEMANAFVFDAVASPRFTREWMEVVKRDYNHPSIFMWIPINENWGVPNLSDQRQQEYLRSLYTLTRSLDATRLVVDNDGFGHTSLTDLFTLHCYATSGEVLAQTFQNLGKPGFLIQADEPALVPGQAYNGSPFMLSEFGGIAYIPPNTEVPKTAWGYAGVEKTPEAVLERLRSLYTAISRQPAFIGFCYTQLTDVEQEINGLLTYDRKLKFDPKAIRSINELLP